MRSQHAPSYLLVIALILGVITLLAAWRFAALQAPRDMNSSPVPTPKLAPVSPPAELGVSVFPLGDSSVGGQGQVVARISCDPQEMTDIHIHAHLSLYVQGKQYRIPSQIGVVPRAAKGPCLYAVHTHDASGMIHIESKPRGYRLGDFFKIWGQSLSRHSVGPYRGKVVVFLNGKLFNADPREIPLTAYQQVALEVGSRLVSPPNFIFPAGQ